MASTTKKTASKTGSKKNAGNASTAPRKKTTASKTAGDKTTKKKPQAKKKTASKQVTASKATVRKATARNTGAPKAAPRQITAAQRHQLIAEAAYLRAESQGFFGDQREDWVLAEAEVDARLHKANVRVVG